MAHVRLRISAGRAGVLSGRRPRIHSRVFDPARDIRGRSRPDRVGRCPQRPDSKAVAPLAVPDEALDKQFREQLGQFQAPPGYEFMLEKEKIGSEELYRPHFVSRRRDLAGDTLRDARDELTGLQYVVNLRFDATGADGSGSDTSAFDSGGGSEGKRRLRK